MTAGFFISAVVPGWCEAPDPEPRDSGFALRAPRNDRASQKALRIDIDLELEIALCLWPRGEPFAQVLRQIDIAQRLHQQTEAIAALDHGERRFCRAQHLHPLIERR